MHNELILNPEELFYLGKLMGGTYYNYSYFAAIEGVRAGSQTYQWKSREDLIAHGILEESFSGDLQLSPGFDRLLEPVLLGKFQSLLQICENGAETRYGELHFHWHRHNGTMLYEHDGKMVLRAIDEERMRGLVLGLMPEKYNCSPAPQETIEVTLSQSKRIFSFKNFDPERESQHWMVYECGGWLIEYMPDGELALVAPKTFVDRAVGLLMEV